MVLITIESLTKVKLTQLTNQNASKRAFERRPFFFTLRMREKDLFDLDFIKKETSFLAGCDEVGRGPLAGPVVACCVFWDLKSEKRVEEVLKTLSTLGVTDSKGLSEKKRERIIEELELHQLESGRNLNLLPAIFNSLSFRVEEVSALEIDQINILQASLLAMLRAYEGLSKSHSYTEGVLLIDGNKKLAGGLGLPIVKGDAKSLVIGLASIIAKVYRDRLMKDMEKLYPEYGFAENAGYPTEKHRKAIQKFGPTVIHRKTFKGVKEYL